MLDDVFIQEILSITKNVGKFVLQESAQFDKTKIQNKSHFDLVSYVDIETEKKLITQLSKLLPEAGFIAEESQLHSNKDWNWIIDPLDGTTNFTRNLPSFAISVALSHKKDVHLGVVYNIPTNEMFWAAKGKGAYLNDKKIKVSTESELSKSLIATGFSVSRFDRIDVHLAIVKEIITHSLGIRRMGAAAIDLCYVACGRFDAFFEWYLNPWDVAAGSLIAQEAGATLSDFSGNNNYLYGGEILCVQPNLYHKILNIIQSQLV